MDTPERNQTGTPLSKFEFPPLQESPVFNYINSLSPLKPVKSVNISQTFNSLSFAAIPSIFTSPHIKELKFLRRHQSSDQFKYGNSTDNGNKLGSSDITDALQLSGEHAVQLSESLKFECGSCEGIPTQCSDGVPGVAGRPSASLVPSVKEARGNLLLQDEVLFQEICQTEQKREDLGCDWKSLISNAADLLIFGSPGTETFQEPIQKSSDPDTSFCVSPASEFPQDDLSDLHKQCNVPVSSSEQQEPGDPSRELKEVDQACDSLADTCASKCVASHRPNNVDDEAGKCIPFAYEPIINLRGGMRRRCLVYDMTGAHRRNLNNVSDSGSSSLSQFGGNTDKQLVPFRLGIDAPLSGIGLHLNSLAAPSKDHKIIRHEIVATESQLISRPNSIAASHSPSIDQEPTTNSLNLNCSERDEDPNEIGLDVAEDILQASAAAAIEDLNQTSPRNKRRKLEQTGEPEGCKHCNCKKSRCLKLYCECFAAGVYCAEPCSCQECFNRPIHEDTVLATRKQIESRNPLAFAPKVIRSSDSIAEIGDEPNKTPASARHKRGCNCKKSSCLKKYCECYQGGVGCSINCRCEGCKNAFGRKDGAQLGTDADPEEEETETGERSGAGLRLLNTIVPYNKEQNLDSAPPITPFHMGRPSTRLPSSSKRKPPRSTFLAAKYGKPNLPQPPQKFVKHFQTVVGNEIPDVLRGNGSPNGAMKTASPNSKRVSPPHCDTGQSPGRRGGRRLILHSIPSFPSLTQN